jgi:hypothetical protein
LHAGSCFICKTCWLQNLLLTLNRLHPLPCSMVSQYRFQTRTTYPLRRVNGLSSSVVLPASARLQFSFSKQAGIKSWPLVRHRLLRYTTSPPCSNYIITMCATTAPQVHWRRRQRQLQTVRGSSNHVHCGKNRRKAVSRL